MRPIRLAWIAAILALSGCTATQIQTADATGRLYCAKATADGPLIVGLVSAVAPGSIIATGATAAFVQAACALVDAIPVSPPADPAAAPVVAIVPPLSTTT